MKKIAIVGGGIAGLAAAYELEKARKRNPDIDWHLYEASNRLGGTVETTRIGDYILEGGPDAWITDKPWARDLAVELGLEPDLIPSNDATRKTYILTHGQLQPMPDRMRMMVPEDLATLESSPLFTPEARAAYAAELTRADELKTSIPDHDESVADFVRRHFGTEVLTKIAAPLLSGVFGGDVHKLSVRAVMAPFVAMEREHGSLIAALQARANSNKPRPAIFTSLRRGMASLTAALIATLPTDRLHLNHTALSLKREGKLWCLRTANTNANGLPGKSKRHVHHILLATPIDATRTLLEPRDPEAAALIPTNASSAVLATFCWPSETAATFTIPPGFGFLVPPANQSAPPSTTSEGAGGFSPLNETHLKGALAPATPATEPQLLACTFVDQKFPHRAPTGARIIRTFFGGESAATLAPQSDDAVAAAAFTQLNKILGPIPTPDPNLTTIRRWPRSLPQYEVGHLDRMVTLDEHIAALGDLTLLGNAYRGVGVPDLIHAARTAAQALTTNH